MLGKDDFLEIGELINLFNLFGIFLPHLITTLIESFKTKGIINIQDLIEFLQLVKDEIKIEVGIELLFDFIFKNSNINQIIEEKRDIFRKLIRNIQIFTVYFEKVLKQVFNTW